MDIKSRLLEDLARFEQYHIEHLSKLEQAIKSDNHYTVRPDNQLSEITQWLSKFQTRDDTLKELLTAVDAPHTQLRNLAETVINHCEHSQTDKALEELNQSKATSLRQLQSLFLRIREQIESAVRQVLLFVTLDGSTPLYALIIDEINDVLSYESSDFHPSNDGSLKHFSQIDKVIDGVFTKTNTPDCIYFNIQKLVDVNQLNVTGN
jgi:hypothetical protein